MVLLATAVVVTEKVAVVCPAITVTLDGSAAAWLLLVRLTAAPPIGAAPLRVTVAVADVPPVSDVGLSETEESEAAFTVKVAVWVLPQVAEIVTGVGVETADVDTIKVAVFLPAATVTLAGGHAADGLLVPSVTTAPPLGAGPLRVTVPVDETPPSTVAGLRPSDDTTGGFTVMAAD